MNIRKAIKDAGWTLDRLASEMKNREGQKGVSQAAVSQIINGNPTLSKLQEIATIMGITVADLVKEEPEGELWTHEVRCPHCGQIIRLAITAEAQHTAGGAAGEKRQDQMGTPEERKESTMSE